VGANAPRQPPGESTIGLIVTFRPLAFARATAVFIAASVGVRLGSTVIAFEFSAAGTTSA